MSKISKKKMDERALKALELASVFKGKLAPDHPDTQASEHTEAQAPEHPDTQTSGHTEAQAPEHPDTQTSGHTEAQAPEHPDIQASGHTEAQAYTPPNRQRMAIKFPAWLQASLDRRAKESKLENIELTITSMVEGAVYLAIARGELDLTLFGEESRKEALHRLKAGPDSALRDLEVKALKKLLKK